MIKNIFIDFDGTILPKKYKEIPISCIEALNKAHENGTKVFLCTGRSYTQLDEFDIKRINFDGLITASGQIVFNKDGELLYDCPLPKKVQDKLIEVFNKKEIPICLLSKDDFYINIVNKFVIDKQNESCQSIPKVKEYDGKDIYLASCFTENDNQRRELIRLSNDVHIFLWRSNGLDILNKDASKRNGIEQVIKLYNLDKNECLGIGDSYNDLPMFDICKYSIAVGNASDDIKKYATYVCEDVEDDGILKALKHYNLI